MNSPVLSPGARFAVLAAAFLGLVFDGVELGMMPVASLSVSQSLLGESYTASAGGNWFAWFTAALMLGAAIGGVWLGSLGDRLGRTRAMGLSILFYSLFAGLGSFATTQTEMLILRFLVGLGVGGVWPNGMALVSECWPNASRPLVSGVMSAGLNFGILCLSQMARIWPITPDSWRWLFQLAGFPALLGLIVLTLLPESPKWLASRGEATPVQTPLRELFSPSLWRITLLGIVISSIPMVGAWAASKWMIPWSDKIAGPTNVSYKAATQGWWALGATLGSFAGSQVASMLGRRLSYAIVSVGSCALTVAMFQATAPLQPGFHAVVFVQGLVSTLFFGWLALFLPELFPTHVRASGVGLAYNSGRFATAAGVLAVGFLFTIQGGDYPKVGALCATIYGLGLIAILFAPDTSRSSLNE